MEHRILLTQQEAFELSNKLEFIEISYVKDTYDGKKRIRTDLTNDHNKKLYPTPVKGTIVRFSAKCKLGNIENIWYEVKWTNNTVRFEIEFENEVPKEFKNRPNIKGWNILINK